MPFRGALQCGAAAKSQSLLLKLPLMSSNDNVRCQSVGKSEGVTTLSQLVVNSLGGRQRAAAGGCGRFLQVRNLI